MLESVDTTVSGGGASDGEPEVAPVVENPTPEVTPNAEAPQVVLAGNQVAGVVDTFNSDSVELPDDSPPEPEQVTTQPAPAPHSEISRYD